MLNQWPLKPFVKQRVKQSAVTKTACSANEIRLLMLQLTTMDLSEQLTDRQQFVHSAKRQAHSILQRKPVKDKQ